MIAKDTCTRCDDKGWISTKNIIGDPTWEACPKCASPTNEDKYIHLVVGGKTLLKINSAGKIFIDDQETSDVERIGATFREWALAMMAVEGKFTW
jgi:hypothetical protein